jgi:hypothetical protein
VTRYFFDIVEAGEQTLDEVGKELVDETAARNQAAFLLIEVARDMVRDGGVAALAVNVRNQGGKPGFHATLDLQFSGLNEGAARG